MPELKLIVILCSISCFSLFANRCCHRT